MEMDHILTFDPATLPAILGIGGVTLAFVLYYFVMISPKVEARITKGLDPVLAQARWIVFGRVWGGLVLGLAALLLPPIGLGRSPFEYGMSFSLSGEAALITAGLGALIIFINLLRAGKPGNLVQYPQIRCPEWSPSLFLQSTMGWIIYLLGYELMFRGFFLYACVETLGIWPAIAINASVYAFAHFFKGLGETLGAIPFGVLMCVLTLYTGNFMLAFLVHCFLAISNQTVALWSHPEMHWKKA